VLASKDRLIGCGGRWTTSSAFIAGFVALEDALKADGSSVIHELHTISPFSLRGLWTREPSHFSGG
jgi:hypothetical protein